ncbi:D-alanyl-D-alanine carboxypeptidase family protein [Aquabacterium sp.]|uniref:D-alanyl-D-alanine carboxypeptidase family protein n=1 Tax=Aquabacterium sp. TaxID=1872578 RepID=UPI0035AE6E83
MNRIIRTLTAGLLSLASWAAQAQAPQPPEIAARSYILLDVNSSQVLAAKDPDMSVEPASLTKLMSAYLVFQALKDGKLTLQQEVTVSERAWRTGMTGASRSYIDVGSRVKVEDLVKGMIVQSGNDATVALAEAVGGSVEHFVELMNRQAQAFGLKSTSFKNPEGLPAAGHVSTARELMIIAAHVVRDFPQYSSYDAMKEFTYNKIKQQNRNLLLWRDPTVDGLKTGYTDAAGYCMIATAKRDTPSGQRRLLSVVLGTASSEARANESQKLLNWGYSAFDNVKLYEAGQSLADARVWKGHANQVKLGSLEPLLVTVPRGAGSSLKTEIQRTDPLLAPLAKGQRVGTIKITSGGQVVTERPLVALDAVGSAGFLGRAWDAVRLGIQ